MKILVIIDMQGDFIDGSLGTPEAQAIVPKVVEKLNNYPNKGNTLLLFTKDTHHVDYLETFEGKNLPVEHCIENTTGWSINKEISDAAKNKGFLTCSTADIINSRIYKGTFGSDVLRDYVLDNAENIDEIEICGLCTGICVLSNALSLRQAVPWMPISVDASCCACVTPKSHKEALNVMKLCQINVINE